MKKFKVNVIELLLKNNTTAKFGEIVTEDQLNSDSSKLLEDGYIKKATKSDLEPKKEEKENPVSSEYKTWTKAALNEELDKRKIEHDAEATNQVLSDLLYKDDEENK